MFLFGLSAGEKEVHRFQMSMFIFYYYDIQLESNVTITLMKY